MKEMDTMGRRRAVPNYLQIQKAKEDYVQLHDFYTAHRQLLGDETAGRLFASLMDVSTPGQLEQWQEDIAGSSLSLQNNTLLTKGVKWENLLGHYDLLLRDMSAEDRDTVAFELPKIRKNGFGLYFNRNMATLCSEASQARKEKDNTIVILYDQIDNHITVGEDADRLFEIFGWQTATACVGDERMSIMPISDDVLLSSGMLNFQLTETMVDLIDIHVDDPMEAELAIAQQTIDAFRRKFEDDMLFPAGGLRHYSIQHCIEHEYTYPFVEKKGVNLRLIRSDARYESVVSGQSWNVSRERIPLITSLAEYLHVLMHDKEKQCKVIGAEGRTMRSLMAQIVTDEYKGRKMRYEDKRLIVDHGAFLEAYGDDAVSLARQLHFPLWCRHGGTNGDMIMALLTRNLADIAEAISDDVVVVKGHTCDEMSKMCLKPSFLNDSLLLDDSYKDASVFVKKDGSYAVRASKNGEVLPMRTIPRELGTQYLEMTDRLAQNVFLNGILHAVYSDLDPTRPILQSNNIQNIQTK